MKPLEEIIKDEQIKEIEAWDFGDDAYNGILILTGQTKKFIFCMSVDECQNGKREHVSVSLKNSNKTLPTWKDMCRIKDIFWNGDEEVHQIHPKAEQYVHGVGDTENVLHLWRPVGGWREFEE